LQYNIIHISYRKFREAKADASALAEKHRNHSDKNWHSGLMAGLSARIHELEHFFWECRADINLGPITLTPETGALELCRDETESDVEA